MRFGQAIHTEAATPDPKGGLVKIMLGHLRRFLRNLRRKEGWYPDFSVVSYEEMNEEDEGQMTMEIATLIQLCRHNKLPSRVTEKTTRKVLDAVRLWAVRRKAERKKLDFLPQEDMNKLSSTPLFSPLIEEQVEEFEIMHEAGAIDLLEYYLLFSSYKGESVVEAARIIDMIPDTAYSAMREARRKAQICLPLISKNQPLPPFPDTGRPRQELDNDLLMHAINYMAGRGRSLR